MTDYTASNPDTAKLMKIVYRSHKSIGQIAKELGVHERTVYRWLSGESRIPKFALMAVDHCVAKGIF